MDAAPPSKRLDALPVLYLVGFVILTSALIYLWRHPATPLGVVQETVRVDTLGQDLDTAKQQTATLAARVAAVEARPAPVVPPAPDLGPIIARLGALEARAPAPAADLGPLVARISALEGRAPPPSVNLGPLEARIAALEVRPPPPVELGLLSARIAALEKKQADDAVGLGARLAEAAGAGAALAPRIDQADARTQALAKQDAARLDAVDARAAADEVQLKQLLARVVAVEAQTKQASAGMDAIAERTKRIGRLQAAAVALEAGQRLGDIQGAPPTLARFAHDAPPTEAGLRLSFDMAAEAAHRASQPAITDGQSFAERMWTRAQQSVTVRRGDQVVIGDPIAGVLQHAKQQLDAGDLSGAVKILDGMAEPAKVAMGDWLRQAHALLDARAAIAEMAARG